MSGDRLGHTPAPAAPTARHRQSSGQWAGDRGTGGTTMGRSESR